MKAYHFDVKTAFLNRQLHETIYMWVPKEFGYASGAVFKLLNRALAISLAK
jgi:hypothetical protein